MGYPHIHLDAYGFDPAEMERHPGEIRAIVAQAVAADAWIFDGSNSWIRDILAERAQAVVWLDYPWHVTFWRLFCRFVYEIVTRQTLLSGRMRSFRREFCSLDSSLLKVLLLHRQRRAHYYGRIVGADGAYFLVFRHRSPKQTRGRRNLQSGGPTANSSPERISR